LVAGALVLLLAAIVVLPPGRQVALSLLLGGAFGLMVLGGGDLGRKLIALAGALIFPVLAFVWFPVAVDEERDGGTGGAQHEHEHEPARSITGPSLTAFVLLTSARARA